MIEAGDDPLFVLRRMIIFASEDVGLADSRALLVVNAPPTKRFAVWECRRGCIRSRTRAATWRPRRNRIPQTWAWHRAKEIIAERGALAGSEKITQRRDEDHEKRGLR